MGNQGWAYTGDAADKALDREIAAQKARREKAGAMRRIWMKPDESKHVTFVDDVKHPKGYDLPFRFMEHQLRIGDRWDNFFTCLGKDCPICEGGNKPYLAEAITVIDHTKYTSKVDNKDHSDELRLFIAKMTVQKILKKAREKKRSLRGWRVEVSRTKAEAPSTGDSFDFEEKVELDSKIQPPDYLELFATRSRADLENILAGKPAEILNYDDEAPVSTTVGDVSDDSEDRVPF